MTGWLKYALVVPAYRERSRKSLRWRLTGSHLLAVFAVPAVILTFIATTAFVLSLVFNQGKVTAQSDANSVAERLSAGRFGLGPGFPAGTTVSLIGPNGFVIDSNKTALTGSPVGSLGAAAEKAYANALSRTDSASVVGSGHVFGARAAYDPAGQLLGVVLVDERDDSRSAIGSLSWFGNAVAVFGFAAVAGSAIFLIPGLAVASFLGFRRARAVSMPVLELSDAAIAIADGHLDRRAQVSGEDEVATLGRSFNMMADRLQESLRAEAEARSKVEALLAANQELVANASHELRTPVAVIRAHLEALAERPEEADQYTTVALRETDRLERLVDDLFELTRISDGRVVVKREPFDANAAVAEAVDALAEPARRDANLVVRADQGEPGLTAVGDGERVVQVLQNLIRNATRFTPEGGIVLVGAARSGSRVQFTVRDTGGGISAEDLPHIFERFYRADRSRSRTAGGAGLGLAIARDLVQAMGGTLTAESVVGEGSTFTVSLAAL